MDHKAKYELILGIVGVTISVSAFRPELSVMNLDIGIFHINILSYLFAVIVALLVSFYILTLERFLRDTRYGSFKLLDVAMKLSYYIITLVVVSPIAILLAWTINLGIHAFAIIPTDVKKVLSIFASGFIGMLFGYLSKRTATRYEKNKRVEELELLESEEIRDLEIAQRLLEDKYYSQAILESYKILEIHLFRQLKNAGMRVMKNRVQNMIEAALEIGLLKKDDIPKINELRQMRNIAAHGDTEHNESQAIKSVAFVRELITRDA